MTKIKKAPTLLLTSVLLGGTIFFASTTAVKAAIEISPTTVQVGQKLTLTTSDTFAPMSGSESCTDGTGTTEANCAFTTSVWFWRNNYRYKQAPIVSSTSNQIVVTVPSMPSDGNYRIVPEHDYTGRGFDSYHFGLGFENKVKILNPNPPSPKPTPIPSASPTPSPTASDNQVVAVATKTEASAEAAESPSENSSDEQKKQNEEKNLPEPSNLWQKIVFPFKTLWLKLFHRS
jgi:hypothetical protein